MQRLGRTSVSCRSGAKPRELRNVPFSSIRASGVGGKFRIGVLRATTAFGLVSTLRSTVKGWPGSNSFAFASFAFIFAMLFKQSLTRGPVTRQVSRSREW